MGHDVARGAPDDAGARAAAALELVGTDPRAAYEAAEAVLAGLPARFRVPIELSAAAVADRAAGLALRELGDPPAAQRRLQRAVRLAETGGDDVAAAEARMSLAYVLLERGRTRAAMNAADRAAPALRGVRAARLRAQRALVLQRCGHDAEALGEYAAALPVLARARDTAWESHLRNNRALLLAYRGDFAGGEADLRRAYALDLAAGRRSYAADARANLAWLLGVAGDLPASLALFDRIEREDADVAPPERWVDRAEVALRAGLTSEARQVAAAAVDWLEGRGWDALAAEATLQLAQAQLRDGDATAAAGTARTARDLLRAQRRPGWAALADYVEALAAVRSPRDAGAVAAARHGARVADRLDRLGWRSHAAELRLAAGAAATAAGDQGTARTALRPVAAGTRGGPRERGRRWYAKGLLAADPTRRAACLRRAWEAADEERRSVGATELRAVAAPLTGEIVATGLADAVRRGRADGVFRWAERGRTAHLRLPAARPPDDPHLATTLGRLRLAVRDEAAARLDGVVDPSAVSRRTALERAVVGLTRRAAGAAGVRPVGVPEVRDRVDGRVFVMLAGCGDDLLAVVVGEGPATVVPLGPRRRVAAAAGALAFGLRRQAAGMPGAGGDRIAAAAGTLDDLLLGPLRSRLGDAALVVCSPAALAAVPWAALPTCRGRSVSVAPSATSWVSASSDPARASGRVLAVAGPGLAAADREVAAVAAAHPGAVVLAGPAATVAATLEALPDADVAHLAAHGRLRSDNPLFSSLELVDGPLTGYDLERLPKAPRTVLLPACRSGEGVAPQADETLGLAWTLIGRGSAAVVAAVVPVADEVTAGLMADVHRRMAAGASVPEALAAAQADPGDDPVSRATAAAFVVYGA